MTVEDYFLPAVDMIKRHEGLRLTPYKDTVGILTIGYGRNLEGNGISEDEAEILLSNDIMRCLDDLETFSWWRYLNGPRKAAILDWRFQLGGGGIRKFKITLSHLNDRLYNEAGNEMLRSKWARQTPSRAQEIARIVRAGKL